MFRHRLHFGPYRTPRFRIGQRVEDERRGLVRIVELSDGRIPWPVGYGPGGRSLVLYRGLARAVQRETSAAVMHWFGVGPCTVWRWRLALGVRNNEGDFRLKAANGKKNKRAIQAMTVAVQNPAVRAKIAAARRGKPQPPHVIEAARRANTGRPLSAAHRAKIGASHRALGTRPPAAGRPFTAHELRLIRTLLPAEAARRTGRTLKAVYLQRVRMGVANLGRA
jgi:hypothetical protein